MEEKLNITKELKYMNELAQRMEEFIKNIVIQETSADVMVNNIAKKQIFPLSPFVSEAANVVSSLRSVLVDLEELTIRNKLFSLEDESEIEEDSKNS